MAVQPEIWNDNARQLWARIVAHSFEPEGHALTFTARLARDHGWSLAAARRAVDEYKRFCFLAVVAGVEVTPSQEIDEVWHQHLTFSRDYWEIWCPAVLGRALHHRPTEGGPIETSRFAEQYARTLAAYESYFEPPDPSFWPGTAQRFGPAPRFRVVDCNRCLIVPLPNRVLRGLWRVAVLFGWTSFFGLAGSVPASAGVDVLDWTAAPFLLLYVILASIVLAAALAVRALMKQRGSGKGDYRSFNAVELALLAGGRARAADVLALELIEAGHVAVDAGGKLEIARTDRAPAHLTAIREQGTSVPRSKLVGLMAPYFEQAWQRLARDGLAMSRTDVARIKVVTATLVGPVIILGILKIAVGLSRGKPVGYLIVLVFATVFIGMMIGQVTKLATARGEEILRRVRADRPRGLRAPLRNEAIMAFAMVGVTALAGTAFANYGAAVKGSDGSDGGGGGGDGGCGSGGGGCGGCGGD